jgi:hypothetical protein
MGSFFEREKMEARVVAGHDPAGAVKRAAIGWSIAGESGDTISERTRPSEPSGCPTRARRIRRSREANRALPFTSARQRARF